MTEEGFSKKSPLEKGGWTHPAFLKKRSNGVARLFFLKVTFAASQRARDTQVGERSRSAGTQMCFCIGGIWGGVDCVYEWVSSILNGCSQVLLTDMKFIRGVIFSSRLLPSKIQITIKQDANRFVFKQKYCVTILCTD